MAASVQRAVDDILECPICIETMSDSRVLPCVHTFCLACIRKHGNDSKQDEAISCPCCRQTCPVPVGGFEGLPKNILLEKLLEIRGSLVETDASFTSQAHCSNSATTKENHSLRLCHAPCHNEKCSSPPLANSYCVECKGYLCGECWRNHTQQSGTGSHLVLPTGCAAHPEKPLEFYCRTCNMPVCDECFSSTSKHRRHKCSSLSGHVNTLDAEIKALKTKSFQKEALEHENEALRSQVVHIGKIKTENHTLKEKLVKTKQLEKENKSLKSRITCLEKCEREIEIYKAKEILAEKLKTENASLKSKIVELSRHQSSSTLWQETEFHHVASSMSWHSRERDCRVESCEQVMLLCKSCGSQMCLECFTRKLRIEKEHATGAASFLLLIVVVLIVYLIYSLC